MALIDEVRFSLTRLDTALSSSMETELQRYIDEAILNLTNTTDIKPFTELTADALQKGAIIAYCHYCYELDPTRKEEYKKSFDDLKMQMAMSSEYSTLGGSEE